MLRDKLTTWGASLGQSLAQALGERVAFGIELGSPSREQLAGFFRQYRLHHLLPYRSYDPPTQLFYNESSVGFVLECAPLVGCSEEMQREMSGLFQLTLPEGSSLQFLLWADPRIDPWLRRWEGARSPGLFRDLATQRAESIRSRVFAGAHPIRDFRCVISYSEPCQGGILDQGLQSGLHQSRLSQSRLSQPRLLSLKEQLMTSFQTLGSPVKVWEGEDLLQSLDGLINFTPTTAVAPIRWNPYDSLHQQIPQATTAWTVTLEGIKLQGSPQGSPQDSLIRAYSVRREPDYWSLHAMGELIGDPFRELMRLTCPFLIHYGVHIPKQESFQTKVQSRESWVEAQARSKIGKKIPILREQARELDFVRHQLGKGERFVQTAFSVFLMAPESQMESHEQVLLNLYRSKRWHLQRESYLQLQSFLSCLPMTWGEGFCEDLQYHQRLKTTLSTESSNLLPLQGEWKGTSSPGMLLAGRQGQLFTWSPFDNPAGNYNMIVVGRSGSGKSVFMQEQLVCTAGQGGNVFVLDVGRSFEKTVKLLGGQYLEFTPEATLCLNPFSSLPQDNPQETADALGMLKSVVALMAAPKEGTGDLENAHIERALRTVWDEKGQEAEMEDVAAVLRQHPDVIAQSLGTKLFPYTRQGSYGRFFNGPATVDLSASLVCVELEALKERKDLQSVMVQMVILQVTNRLYGGDRKTPSQLFLDEAWDLLRAKQAGVFIETAARRLRKYRGGLVVGTQSMNDFFTSPGAQAAFDNSDWLCLLSQKKESIEQLKKMDRLSMNPQMESLLTSLHTRHGDYAEVLIYGPESYAVGRLFLDPFSQILYSTQASDFTAVQTRLQRGESLLEAVAAVSRPLEKMP
jgi:conjugal transfer ATP-binding protein TraC